MADRQRCGQVDRQVAGGLGPPHETGGDVGLAGVLGGKSDKGHGPSPCHDSPQAVAGARHSHAADAPPAVTREPGGGRGK